MNKYTSAYNNSPIRFALGHAILETKKHDSLQARLLLEDSGRPGLTSVLGALISNGKHYLGHLLSAVEEIAGEPDFQVRDILELEEGDLWYEDMGSYYLLPPNEAGSFCCCGGPRRPAESNVSGPMEDAEPVPSDTTVGFSLLRTAQSLKLRFHEAGYEGRVSFVKACISTGMVWDHTIVQAAVAIAGRHIEDELSFLIEEGENEHWGRNENGELYVI